VASFKNGFAFSVQIRYPEARIIGFPVNYGKSIAKRCTMCEYSEEACANREKLVSDLRKVIDDADEILRETAGVAGEKIAVLRGRITEHLNDAKARLEIVESQFVDKTKAVAQAADEFVNESPWQAVGIAAGVGVLLGILLGRR
jgi:ElaB/YqjD/DUF883 family membrane-anchored ribosome-binding protein